MIVLNFTVWYSKKGNILEYSVDCEPEIDHGPGFWGVYSRKKDLDEIVDYVVPEMVRRERNGLEWEVKAYEGKMGKKKFDDMVMYTDKPSPKLVSELKDKVKSAIEKYRAMEEQNE